MSMLIIIVYRGFPETRFIQLLLAKIIDDSCLQGIPGNAFHPATDRRILEKFILSK